MTEDVLLAVPDQAASARIAALVREAGWRAVAPVTSATDLWRAVEDLDPPVVVVHEELGPLPAPEVVRELARRSPATAVVLLARRPTVRSTGLAMEAGARAVVALPASLEELQTALVAAGTWSASVRRHLARPGEAARPSAGRVVAVAGARGGAGATTLAVQLALAVAAQEGARVALVDLDLQTGDVPAHLGVTPERSLHDLVDVADDLTPRAVEDTLYSHASGVKVLLSPPEGERGEEIGAALVRGVVGHLTAHFDLVVVDVGASMTEASVAVVDLAHEALVVVTPDVPALRACRRLVALWERLGVRSAGDVKVVLNRASRHDQVRWGLVRTVTTAPVTRVEIPARYRRMEASINAGPADRRRPHPLSRPVRRLADELGVLERPPSRAARVLRGLRGTLPDRGPRPRHAPDAGGGLLDHLVGTVFIGFLVVVVVQLALAGASVVLAGHAADLAARRLAVVSPARPEGRAEIEEQARRDLPVLWRGSARIRLEGDHVAVTVTVPGLLGRGALGLVAPLTVTAERTMQLEWT